MRGMNSKGFKIRSMAPTINQRRSCSGVHLGVQVQNEPKEQQVKDLLAGKPSGEATQAEEENIEKQARQRGFMKLTFYLYRKAVREEKKKGAGGGGCKLFNHLWMQMQKTFLNVRQTLMAKRTDCKSASQGYSEAKIFLWKLF